MKPRSISLAEIRAVTSKGNTEPFLTSMYFIRYFSPMISAMLVKARVSANIVTFVSLIFALLGSVMQASLDPFFPILGAVFLLLYNILDHVDGEVARANYHFFEQSSGLAGGYFDALVHYFYTPVLFFAIGYSAFAQSGQVLPLWAGLITGMWLSAYAQSAAYRVVMDKIVKTGQVPAEFGGVYEHDKVAWLGSSGRQKARFFIREILSNQGQIFILIFCCAIDLWWPLAHSLRFIYLYAMTALGVVQMCRVSYRFFAVLKTIK